MSLKTMVQICLGAAWLLINLISYVDAVAAALVFLLQVCLLVAFFGMRKENDMLRNENKMCRQQIKAMKDYQRERESACAEMRRFRHDYRNHLLCMKEYCVFGQTDKLEAYLDDLIRLHIDNKGTDEAKTGNDTVDALLSAKLALMRQKGISLDQKTQIPSELPVEDTDLAVILGNLLDNAIEAVSVLEPERRRIRLTMEYQKGTLRMLVANPYRGELKKKGGRYLTTKEGTQHGVGLLSVGKSAEKYQGCVQLEEKDGAFFARVMLYCG